MPGSPEFSSLPTEVLRAICVQLQGDHGLGNGDLARLSLTCQRLGDIAQSILYQHFHERHDEPGINIDGDDGDEDDDGRLVPFLRTVILRPDLARYVTELCIDFHGRPCMTEEDFDLFKETASKHQFELPREFIIFTDPRIKKHGPLDLEIDPTTASGIEVVLQLLLLHLPNLQLAEIYIPNSLTTFPHLDIVARQREGEHSGLASFRRLGITNYGSGVRLGSMRNLLAFCPNLEILQVSRCRNVVPDLPLSNLVKLEIDPGDLSFNHLSELLGSCPKLEAFKYRSEWNPRVRFWGLDLPFNPREALEALRPFQAQLKILELDLSERDRFSDREEEKEFITSLREFSALERIKLHCSAIFSGGERAQPGSRNGRFAELLPGSVKHLILVQPYPSMYRDLLKLGKCAASRFPSLGTVEVQWTPKNMPSGFTVSQVADIRWMFKSHGVDLLLDDPTPGSISSMPRFSIRP